MAEQEALGTRINNPLNIRHSEENQWVGMTGTENGFVEFQDSAHGYRAADKVLRSYGEAGINTISGVINRFAPPSENDTPNYVDFVSHAVNMSPDERIDLGNPSVRRTLLSAMARMETGETVTSEQISDMIDRAERGQGGGAEAFPVAMPRVEEPEFEIDPVRGIMQEDNSARVVIDAMQHSMPRARRNTENMALDLTLVKSAINPALDMQQTYKESLEELGNSADPEAYIESFRRQYADKQRQYVVKSTVNLAATGQMTPEQATENIRESEKISEKYKGLAGQERIFAENTAPLSMNEFSLQEEVARNYTWSEYKKWAEDIGTWDTVKNYLGAFFVPDFIKDANDLVDGNLFRTKKDIINLVHNYNMLSPEKRIEVFGKIFPQIREAYDDNHLKVAGFISMLHSVDPGTEFDVGAVSDAIDILFSGTVAAGVNVAKGVIRGTNVAKKAKRMNADLESAILSEAPGNEIGQVEKAVNKSPFDMEDQIPFFDSTDGISKPSLEMAEKIRRSVEREVRRPARKVGDEDFTIDVDALKPEEKQRAVDEFLETRKSEAEERDILFEQIEPVTMDKDGFTVKYKWDGGRVTENRKWLETDAGTFIETNPGFKRNGTLKTALSNILSPDLMLANVAGDMVQDLTRGGLQASRIKNSLIQIHKNINKGMKKDEVVRVNELLIAGDEAETIWKLDDLLNGNVQVHSGMTPYSFKEIENYYKKVAFSQELWMFRNYSIKKQLDFMGARHIEMWFDNEKYGRDLLGVPNKDIQSVKNGLENQENVFAPQLTESGIMRADEIDTALADEGYVMVRLVQPYKTDSGKTARWALIKNEGKEGNITIKDLPDKVLNRIEGYVPRIYKEGYHFVKDLDTGETRRAFSSKKAAVKYIEDQSSKNPDLRLEVFRDRELDRFEQLSEDANMYGGLFTGARKKTEPLLLDEAEGPLQRMSYGDAMNRYINNVSEEMNLNQYRMALKERWINTVNALAKAEPGGKTFGVDPKADWKTAPITISDAALRKQMEFARDYIIRQSQIRSPGERIFENFLKDIAENTEGKFGNFVSNAAMDLSSKNPVTAMRAATFYAHLGWFNLRQLYVQAQNASLALSMYPKLAPDAVNRMVGMRALMYMSDEALDNIKETNKFKLGHLVDDVKAFNRSGLKDSILRNADFDAAREGYGAGTMQAFRRVAQKGLTFYENGELASRLIAWNIAKSKKGWKGAKLTDNQISELVDETFRLHMNLQRENAAWWQTNALSIPTQFMQVQAKFVENIITGLKGGGKWSRAEARNALIGQLVLYGTVGVPVAEGFTEWFMDKAGYTPEELQKNHPNLAEFVADGANGLMFELLGFENQFGGDTASLPAGLDDNVVTGLFQALSNTFSGRYGGDTIGDVIFGPTINTFSRGTDAFIGIAEGVKALWARPTIEGSGELMLKAADDFLATTSTWSNARKARELFRLKESFTKKGNITIGEHNISGMNFLTKLAAGMGFTTDVEASYWALKKENRDRALDLAAKKDEVKRAAIHALKTGHIERYRGLLALHSEGMSPIEYHEMVDSIVKDIVKDQVESDLDKEYKKYIMQLIRSGGRIPGQLESMNILDATQEETE